MHRVPRSPARSAQAPAWALTAAWRTALALVVAPAVLAQDPGEPVRVRLRVASSPVAGQATIDRGARDAVEIGDTVELRPRGGAPVTGRVIHVSERASLVELQDRTWRPPPGTRGDVLVPAARLAKPDAADPGQLPPRDPASEPRDPAPSPPAGAGRDHPGWQGRDDEFEPGMPLLAEVRPGRPASRPLRATGRFYSIGALVRDFEGRGQESFVRAGVDLDVDNPLGYGGRVRFNSEGAWLTETNEQTGTDLNVREMSYAWGGDRFSPNGWEVGRFLQGPMPEFGILDGAQWTRRLDDHWRVSASAGFLPELGEDLDSGEDFQIAGSVIWSADTSDRWTVGIGYQKTFHNGRTDRDLFVLRTDLRPEASTWTLHGSLWIDLHSGRDDLEGNGPALTMGNVTWRSADAEGGVEWAWRHQEFPQLLRDGEFPPVLDREIANNRYDGLSWTGWSGSRTGAEVRGHLTLWDDEDDAGFAAELGFADVGVLGFEGRTDLTFYGGMARFTDDVGVRLSHARRYDTWHWSGLYDFGYHHLVDYPSDGDALFQHRLRATLGYATESGWDGDVFTELTAQDGELAATIGFYVQHGF